MEREGKELFIMNDGKDGDTVCTKSRCHNSTRAYSLKLNTCNIVGVSILC